MGHLPLRAEISQGKDNKLRFKAWQISKGSRRWQQLDLNRSKKVRIRTADNVASLDVAGGRADGSRIVVNVFVSENDDTSKASMNGEQFVVYKMLRREAGFHDETHDPAFDECLLGPHNFKAVETICKRKVVVDSFRPLLEHVFPWSNMHIPMFEDMRKCWCFEEIANYLKHMNGQLKEITLGYDRRVVPYIDAESLRKLESRAPMFSVLDREYVVSLFKDKETFFKGLSNEMLRTQVEAAVCKQGPMLSLATLARDVRVLLSTIRLPLTNVMGKFSNAPEREDTVRKKMVEYFDELLVKPLQPTGHGSPCSRYVNAGGCYQRLFFQLLRRGPKQAGMLTQDMDSYLDEVVRKERNNVVYESWSTEDIFKNDDKGPSGHGHRLFEDASKTASEFRESILGPFGSTESLRKGVMARYLACVFLFNPQEIDIMTHPAKHNVPRSPIFSLPPSISVPDRAFLRSVPKQATHISRRNSWLRSYRASRCGSSYSPTLCETLSIVSPSSVYSHQDSLPPSSMSWPSREISQEMCTSKVHKKRQGMYFLGRPSTRSRRTSQGSIKRVAHPSSPSSVPSALLQTTRSNHWPSQSICSGSSVYANYDSRPSTGLTLVEGWESMINSYMKAVRPDFMSSAVLTGNGSDGTAVDADESPFSLPTQSKTPPTGPWASPPTRIVSPEHSPWTQSRVYPNNPLSSSSGCGWPIAPSECDRFSSPDVASPSIPFQAPPPAHKEPEVITFILRGTGNQNKNLDKFNIIRSKHQVERFLENQLAHNAETGFTCRGIESVIAPEPHDHTRMVAQDGAEKERLLVDSILVSKEVIVFSANGWKATTYPYQLT